MKSFSKYLAASAVLAVTFSSTLLHAQYDASAPPPPPGAGGPPPDQGDDQGASFQQFYDQLGDQGSWVQTDNYGYVFQPNVQDPNWAPYSDGHWAYTDDGYMWVSDEPWGWATYHYGRWANIDGMGWAWVPGYQWAPAWVSWRYGGGYCGWAPLPPETFIGAEYGQPGVAIGIGFHFGGDVDVSFNIGPGCYNFVPIGYIGERNYRGRYLDRSRNYTVINNTTNITNININRNGGSGGRFRGVAAGGPPINEINAHATTRLQRVRLAESNQPGRASLNGDTLSVYAPRVNAASQREARPARVARTISNPTFNRGDSISRPMQVTPGIQGRTASQEDIRAAQTAAAQAPARAKVANERTQARTQFTQPLTSLQPAATRQERAATNREANQDRALQNKDARTERREADKTANQDRIQRDKDARVQPAEANKAAYQDRAQEDKPERTRAADERATRQQQEGVNQPQGQPDRQTAAQDAAQARQERMDAATQKREPRADAGQQQHTAVQQQRASGPDQGSQQHAPGSQQHAPANHEKAPAGEKDKKGQDAQQGR